MAEMLLERAHTRPPQSETYGRSLSTIYRLGAFMVEKSLPEIIKSPEADQARVEFYTSVEEGFGTDMELGGGLEVRDFDTRPIINGRVMAKNLKTPVSDMTEAGLICAEETEKKDSRFLPQLTRSRWDHENAVLVDWMAQGFTDYNTRIVVSPFPEEAAKQSGNDYWQNIGYVPHLKRGFVQLYHATKEGLITGSLSFDGSDKEQLRSIFSKYGMEIPETEITDNWLQYAITDTLSEDEAKQLALDIADTAGNPNYKKNTNTVDVTHEFGKIIDQVFDESYVHICESLFRGRQTSGARELIFQLADKAGHFNGRYAKALYGMRANPDRFTNDDSAVLHELLVYSTIEMMRALHIKNKLQSPNTITFYSNAQPDIAHLQSLSPGAFQNMLGGFGAEGARNNRTYSACGLSISAGNNERTSLESADSPQTTFGGAEQKGSLPDDKFGPRQFRCPKKGCLNTRPEGKLIKHCQKCGADVTCK